MGPKLGKGQQTPFPSSWGVAWLCAAMGLGPGKRKAEHLPLLFSLSHNSIMRGVLQTCPLALPARSSISS